jgi:aryl-alcohol dehydrogenase (NADP+)
MSMHHTRFGHTGLQVSRLCFGTMTFGLKCDEARGHAILDAAADGSIDFIDTADTYPMGGGPATAGGTEKIVGKWLKTRCHRFIVHQMRR